MSNIFFHLKNEETSLLAGKCWGTVGHKMCKTKKWFVAITPENQEILENERKSKTQQN
jgi:hypothetical protein